MQTYYDTLITQEQRRAYESIKYALEQKSAYADARCNEGFDRVYEAVIMDNPLCCVSHPWTQCSYDGRSYAFQYIDVREDTFFSELDKVEKQIRQRFQNGADKSQYALYKAIFDVLTEIIKYDHKAYAAYGRCQDFDDLDRYLMRYGVLFSPYGAIVDKKAVCNGIAKLYQILCHRFGLQCNCVQACSVNTNNGNCRTEITDDTQCDHLLNVVEIDGVQAFVDVTNGLVTDTVPMTIYDYFAVNYEVLSKSYLLRPRDLQIFRCNGEDNLYFRKNGLVFSSIGEYRRYLINYIAKFRRGQIRVYYNGGKLSDDELVDIFEDIVVSHCPATKGIEGNIRNRDGFTNCVIGDG